jgi:hypothetical protein
MHTKRFDTIISLAANLKGLFVRLRFFDASAVYVSHVVICPERLR